MAKTKEERRQFIKKSIRKKISGTAQRPRMSVFRSNKQIYVQLIDDEVGKTLAAASSRENGIENEKITKTEQAASRWPTQLVMEDLNSNCHGRS